MVLKSKSIILKADLGKGKISRHRKHRKYNPNRQDRDDVVLIHKPKDQISEEKELKEDKKDINKGVVKVEKVAPGITIPASTTKSDFEEVEAAIRGLNAKNAFMPELEAIATMGDTIKNMLKRINEENLYTNKNHKKIVSLLKKIADLCTKVEGLF